MSWKKFLIPASAVPVLALLAWGLTRDPNLIPSPLPGLPAPDFTLQTLSGDTVALADLEGKVVVVNFWASWCLSCIDEHYAFTEASRRYADQDVRLLGVVYNDSRENAIAWLRRMGGGWPSLLDPGSRTAIDYGVYGVPETFFIDRTGRVAYKQLGPVSRGVLTTWVDRLLAADHVPVPGEEATGKSEGYVPVLPDADQARTSRGSTGT
ncbi:MAG: TlpA family protein disulfide reductase [Gemmatimonadota bacterium]